MKKLISLIKACMTDNMRFFCIKTKSKKKNKSTNKLIPIFLVSAIFISIWSYANMMMEPLRGINLEFVLLSLFALFTSLFVLIEGIYKASSLLFNCKDDNLLFSLPIKRSTVLFIRIFKFYIFELFFNILFLLPAIVVYVSYIHPNITFYIVSLIALILFPIIPIVVSCIIGGIISITSSKFKLKNLAQICITMIFLLIVMYVSFNLQNVIKNIAQNASSINDIITKLYYPVGAYIKLITNFNIKDLALFIIIHLVVFIGMIFVLSKIYFKINSNVKSVKTLHNKSEYTIKTRKPMLALIKKEFNRFVSTPVFVINSGFGLVFYIALCVLVSLKIESSLQMISGQGIDISFNVQDVIQYIPLIQFGLVCFASLMSSITCSMISLEGKSFSILKSLPIKPAKIVLSKVYAAVAIMIPFILIGDLIMFIRFKFSILEMVMILIASIILPLVSELIGIIVNLKYPKMDAENDTEVVKQSMSSFVAVFAGMILLGVTIFLLVKAVQFNIQNSLIILIGLLAYTLIYIILLLYLKRKGVKEFNSINV